MSKERLEEIKGVLKSWEVWNDWNEAQRKVLKDPVYYLERVQELEDIIYQDERQAVLEGMYEQNKRYREALEFIGNHANESEMMDDVMYTALVKEVIEKALEE